MKNILYGSTKNTLRLGDTNIFCFVLEQEQRVLEITTIQKALGYSGKFENWLFEFLSDLNILMPVPITLLVAYSNPIKIEINEIGEKKAIVNVIDCDLFFETLKLITKARNENLIHYTQQKFAQSAQMLLDQIGNAKIESLIDNASGFSIFKENIYIKTIALLKAKQDNPAFDWISTIPGSFFETILTMNNLSWLDINDFPETIAAFINDIIYLRIDEETIHELALQKPARVYKTKNNQYKDRQHPKLKDYSIVLLTLAKASGFNWPIFMQLLNKTYPKQINRQEIFFPQSGDKKPKVYSKFDENLTRALQTRPQ